MSARPELTDRACPTCKAPRGEPCVSRTGGTVLEYGHSRRVDVMNRRRNDWQFEQQEAGRS